MSCRADVPATNTTPGSGFNTYGVLWTPTTITTYFNGMSCFADVYRPHVTNPDTAPRALRAALLPQLHGGVRHGPQRRQHAHADARPQPRSTAARPAIRLTPPRPGYGPFGAIASGAVEFSKELRDDIAAGDISVSFRLWRRPQAKVGGRYRVGRVEIEVDAIDIVSFASITKADVRRAGEVDKEALRNRAAHAGPVAEDTELYRIAFHVARELG
jgi:hypothetical protein